ncbi:MAG TPA: carbamoyl-phosphate-synthetase [Firmicutes bacterium]|nr:carbamoyl-phosphate-synthetase [Bacillota bacterium]
MKRLMILGGSENQLPLIQCAKQQAYFLIVCDHASDNVGRVYADRFYCVSTLDREAVLSIARAERIDGIVTNSEPAMSTSAYVGNMLGLVSNPHESVITLSRKDLFRSFLRKNGFACPRSLACSNYEGLSGMVNDLEFPLMVKPVDSSGSRGVTYISSSQELRKAFCKALGFSTLKRVIVEEYIERAHDYLIGGDIFVVDGRVSVWGLMNCIRDSSVNEFVPVGKSFPAFITTEQSAIIHETIHDLVSKLHIRFGAFNVELMFGPHNRLYVIEMNPRNGGNRIPDILKEITGVDLIKATISASLNAQDIDLTYEKRAQYMSTYILHSSRNGILRNVILDDRIMYNVVETTLYKQIGDAVSKFDNAEHRIGIMFLRFRSLEEMKEKTANICDLIKVIIQ